jgi:hypothetical protein
MKNNEDHISSMEDDIVDGAANPRKRVFGLLILVCCVFFIDESDYDVTFPE